MLKKKYTMSCITKGCVAYLDRRLIVFFLVFLQNCVTSSVPAVPQVESITGSTTDVDRWNEACGRSIVAEEGIVTSLGYPKNYTNNLSCHWKITAPYGSQISISVKDVDLPNTGHGYCSVFSDHMNITEETITGPLLCTLCNEHGLQHITSSSNVIIISQYSDSYTTGRGFSIEFISMPANIQRRNNGNLVHPKNLFPLLPGIAAMSVGDMELKHRNEEFSSTTSFRRKLLATAFDISKLNDEIHESSTKGPLEHQLNNDCRHLLGKPSEIVTSPKYPSPYPSDSFCEWTIQACETCFISMNFIFIDMPLPSSDGLCDYQQDHILLNASVNGTLVVQGYRLCGFQTGVKFTLPVNNIYLQFISFQNVDFFLGFEMHFETVLSRFGTHDLSTVASLPITAIDTEQSDTIVPTENIVSDNVECGGIFENKSDFITSPLYPLRYPDHLSCKWEITACTNCYILVNFLHINLPPVNEDNPCLDQRDHLVVLNYWQGHSLGEKILCGADLPSPITSGSLILIFNTFNNKLYTGFKLYYRMYKFNSTSDQASTLAPTPTPTTLPQLQTFLNTLNQHPTTEKAQHIETSTPSSISTSDQVNVLSTSDVIQFNPTLNLKILDETELHIQSTETPTPTPTRQIITYPIDHVRGTSSEQSCSEKIYAEKGIVQTPNFPDYYPEHTACVWEITVPSNKPIFLQFLYMDIDNEQINGTCSNMYDHVAVITDFDTGNAVTSLFCGHNPPPKIVTTTSKLRVEFKSKYGIGNGFQAFFKALAIVTDEDKLEQHCNVNKYGPSGVIHSLNFPGYYPPNTLCSWRITVADNKIINLQFLYFDIDSKTVDGRCSEAYDHVKIVEYDVNGNVIKSMLFCRFDIPSVVETSTRRIEITFQSMYGFSTGFDAIYNEIDQPGTTMDINLPTTEITGIITNLQETSSVNNAQTVDIPQQKDECLYDITAEHGLIESPNFPTVYPEQTTCIWKITVPVGKIVVLQFMYMDLDSQYFNATCNHLYDHIAIITGIGTKDQSTMLFCGGDLPQDIDTFTNKLQIEFRSMYGSGTGFQAFFKSFEVNQVNESCEFNTSGPLGVFHSLNFPSYYPPNQLCTWHIIVEAGKVIKLQFLYFDIDSTMNIGPECSEQYDHMKIKEYSTHGDAEEVIILCGSEVPDIIKTATNTIDVVLQSRYGFSTGFDVLYEEIEQDSTDHVIREKLLINDTEIDKNNPCQFDITSEYGVIQSPNFPSTYPLHTTCIWKITAQIGMKISLQILYMDLDQHFNGTCREEYDHIVVKTDVDTEDAVTTLYCGSELPSEIITKFRTLQVEFRSKYGNGTGFHAIFKSVDEKAAAEYVSDYMTDSPERANIQPDDEMCSFIIAGSSGVIQSLNFPSYYPAHQLCFWHIIVGEGKFIRLEFLYFDIDSHTDGEECSELYDNVKIVEYHTDGRVGKTLTLCKFVPDVIIVGSNEMRILFQSKYGFSTGFDAIYNEIDADHGRDWPGLGDISEEVSSPTTQSLTRDCNFDISYDHGLIQSPQFPNQYPHHTTCTWEVTVPLKKIIHLKFLAMDLDFVPINETCNILYDHVTIVTQPGTENAESLVFCGRVLPPELITTTNRLQILFQSMSGQGTGFQVSFESLEPDYITLPEETTSNTPISTSISPPCKFTKTGPAGMLYFPSYHPPNTLCSWHIVVEDNKVIELQFLYFDIDSRMAMGNCSLSYDYLQIVEYSSKSGNVVKSTLVCSPGIPDTIITTTNSIDVIFHSNYGFSTGFKIHYKEIIPLYERVHGHNVATTRAPPEQITQHTDSDCFHVLTSDHGVIQSPNFPSEYPQQTTCIWQITASVGKTISITFLYMDLDFQHINGSCSDVYDHIKVITDVDTEDELSSLHCGDKLPSPILTTTNKLQVEFQSKYGYGTGFQALFKTRDLVPPGDVLEPCDYNLSGPSGTLHSLNFPSYYPPYKMCSWTIIVGEGKVIKLEFLHFDMDSRMIGTNCSRSYDHLNIVEYSENGKIVKTSTLCGVDIPDKIETVSNAIDLVFKSNYGHGTGFAAIYKEMPPQFDRHVPGDIVTTDGAIVTRTVDKTSTDTFSESSTTSTEKHEHTAHTSELPGIECNYDITNDYGLMQSPKFPNQYPLHSTCIWRITTSIGNTILLQFLYMDLDFQHFNGTCSDVYDHIKVITDVDTEDELSSLHCGDKLPSPILTTTNKLQVEFQSKYGYGTGFQALFKTRDLAPPGDVLEPCDYKLSGPSGILHSLNFPSYYPPHKICSWNIIVREEKVIQLKFLYFDMDSRMIGTNCSRSYDHLNIVEYSENGKIVKTSTLCGVDIPDKIATVSNAIDIVFKSNYGHGTGFAAIYKEMPPQFDRHLPGDIVTTAGAIVTLTVDKTSTDTFSESSTTSTEKHEHPAYTSELPRIECNYDITNDYGLIQSPKFPNQYPFHSTCIWRITTSIGNTILLQFLYMDLDFQLFNGTCSDVYDHIKVITDVDTEDELSSLHCGNQLPLSIFTTTNKLQVEFQSKYGYGTGFQALYKTRDIAPLGEDFELCNFTLTGPSGTFYSPNFPNYYPPNKHCSWHITVGGGRRIRLQFLYFGVDSSANGNECSENYDHVLILEYKSNGNIKSRKLCGYGIPNVITTSTNEIDVIFQSNYGQSIGFDAIYTEIEVGAAVLIPNKTAVDEQNGQMGEFNDTTEAIHTTSTIQKVTIHRGEVGKGDMDLGNYQKTTFIIAIIAAIACLAMFIFIIGIMVCKRHKRRPKRPRQQPKEKDFAISDNESETERLRYDQWVRHWPLDTPSV
ncbi:cubilin-like [Saccoglossus kowalevskii]|uniref:Cubilin-like n=1 Tax=Saccoglossus kowalevskii TaxID=10224 RepID=A0ABM0MNA4_SACKO|nr:PREDICTED: cubilin-like [Saccoglossus kowalevskii]